MSSHKPTQDSHATEGRQPEQVGDGNKEITIACTIELRVAAGDGKTKSIRTANGTNADDGSRVQTGQGLDWEHLPESPFVIRLSFEISNPPIR